MIIYETRVNKHRYINQRQVLEPKANTFDSAICILNQQEVSSLRRSRQECLLLEGARNLCIWA